MTSFPPGFFDRIDDDDTAFYRPPRLVTHIDDGAIDAVSDLYEERGLHHGAVLDLMSSWVSHFRTRPGSLTVLGMNAAELAANPMADVRVVQDLNAEPTLPFGDEAFDAVTCCVSIDYLTRPVEVLNDVRRVLRPGGTVVITYSNRCFPTKAIRGWLDSTDAGHADIVGAYLAAATGFSEPIAELRTTPGSRTDPLWAVTAHRI